MSQDNYALLTRTGRLKEAQRMAGQSVPAITHMAFGDMDRAATGGETALGHEVHRAALTGWGAYADQTAAFLDCYLPASVGGFVIREVGLFDAAGDLIAIARRSPGLPKTTPEDGGGDDFTLRIDVFLEDLDTLVVTVSPIAGLTADNLRNFLYPNNLPVEAVLSSAPGAPIAGGQWIVAANPTGIWTGRTGQIARWRGAWEYETPRAGRMASYWSGTRLVQLRHDGTGWAEWLASAQPAGPVELATIEEAKAGLSGLLAVTPAGHAAALARNIFGEVYLVHDAGSLRLNPESGGRILIDGAYRDVPNAGVALASAGNAASTLYYIYAFWTGASVALERSATAPAADPATRQMLKAGDASRTYVGLAYTAGDGAWQAAPLVASHYNKKPRVSFAGAASGNSIGSTSYLAIGPSVPFVTDDGYFVAIGQASVASQNDIVVTSAAPHIALALDNTGAPYAQAPRVHSAAMMGATCFAAAQSISRGRHAVNMIGNAVPGNILYYDNMDVMVLTNG